MFKRIRKHYAWAPEPNTVTTYRLVNGQMVETYRWAIAYRPTH